MMWKGDVIDGVWIYLKNLITFNIFFLNDNSERWRKATKVYKNLNYKAWFRHLDEITVLLCLTQDS